MGAESQRKVSSFFTQLFLENDLLLITGMRETVNKNDH